MNPILNTQPDPFYRPATPQNRSKHSRRWLAVPLALTIAGVGLFVTANPWGGGQSQINQNLSTGSPPIVDLYAPGVVGNGTTTLTEPLAANEGPTFTTGQESILVQNDGSSTATDGTINLGQVTSGTGGAGLGAQLRACVIAQDSENFGATIFYNGPASGAGAIAVLASSGPSPYVLSPGQSFVMSVGFYAGPVVESCGTKTAGNAAAGASGVSNDAQLTNAAAAGVDSLSVSMTWS